MTGFLSSLIEQYRQELEKHRNWSFLKASMAACALVAIANGSVAFRQRVRLDQVLETLDALKIYDPHEGVNLFNEFVEAIEVNPKEGRKGAVRAIRAEAAVDPEKARLLIRMCLAVSEVGGEIPLTEQVEIVGLCSQLGLDPRGFGLYVDAPARGGKGAGE